jgi:RNA polymerase sigma factor (sigma-70 family)
VEQSRSVVPPAASPIVQLIRRAGDDRRVRNLSDHDLLQRVRAGQDPDAFAALVHRHGPMVLDTCHTVLGRGPDVEDAFQATFLVLARKAGSVRKTAALGSWLHGVAYRTALKARALSARRQRYEARVSAVPSVEPDDLSWVEVQRVVHDELNRIAERYRAPLVLCYLEGKTQDQAAAELGLAKSTLRERAERGRAILRARLVRRGLGPAALLTAAAWSGVSTGIPRSLATAVLTAADSGSIPAGVAALTNGVLRNMLRHKIRVATVSALVAFVAAGGTLALLPRLAAQDETPKRTSPTATQESASVPKVVDPDTDGDGLTDFQEVHKYLTNPKTRDTASKGTPDGDWRQRREFNYSVRAVIRIMRPYNLKALTDDYQDVRVLKETKEFAELEVVVYPFNSNAEAISGNPTWKKDYAGMTEHLAPGVTTNWDEAMRKDLLRELADDGIDPDRLADKEVVEQVSRWLFKRSRHRNMFCTFYVGFAGGKPEVLPGLEKAFEKDKGDPKWTTREQLEHELFGKQMFASKTYGTCTSTAVYQTTVLRTLGIPTRMILCIPLADGSDPAQIDLIDRGLTNHRVRCDATLGAIAGGSSFASHTFCEAFVGGRWRRLNYTKLGQNVLEQNYLGLMVHVHTFNDLSEAKLAETWGTRYAKGQRDDAFPHGNPYRLLEVSDHFGQHARVPNPPAAHELTAVTIDKAYWPKDAIPEVRALIPRLQAETEVLPMQDPRFFVHCREWLDDAGDYLQYKLFMRRADRAFVLKAKDQPDVTCEVSMSFYTQHSRNLCELEIVVPSAEYAKMAQGVAYALHPVNGKKGFQWKVADGVRVTRE